MSNRVRMTALVGWIVPAIAMGETVATGDAIVACEVNGYAVVIRNTGSVAIAAQTTVHWSVPFVRMEGDHTLSDALEPAAVVFVSAALGSNFLNKGPQCDASIAAGADKPE